MIDITSLLNGRVSRLEIGYGFDPAENADCSPMIPDDMKLIPPVKVTGFAEDKNGCLFLTAEIEARYETLCDRCLRDIGGIITVPFERMVSLDVPPEEDDESLDNVVFANGSNLDIDRQVTEEIALELPPYHLCKEDCKGLCPKCGKDLNEGPCDCKEEKEIDPRLKILQKLLENSDEL